MSESKIAERVKRILAELPQGVLLVAAAKTRTPEEVRQAIEAGITAIGHNYVQEAEAMRAALGPRIPNVQWRLIGHLQRNKARKACSLFDLIETIDSVRIAEAVNRCCAEFGKIMPVLVEVNSGGEASKSGVLPGQVEALVREIASLPNIRVQGLMTMGPRFGDPEEARPYFKLTKELFDRIAAARVPNVEMRFLSMGMSNSYKVAIEEGANVIRLGTALFGERSG